MPIAGSVTKLVEVEEEENNCLGWASFHSMADDKVGSPWWRAAVPDGNGDGYGYGYGWRDSFALQTGLPRSCSLFNSLQPLFK
ncbi:hypothetical protein SUGI_0516630 [Cryptomeria japonica]|nr:hypothetical protein SUGI_0516630 [Cryptomeria japonica]